MRRNELRVVPAVFDEPAAGGAATAHGAGHEQAGPGGFVGGGVEERGAGFVGRVGLHAEAAEQGLVGVVAGEGVHEIGGDAERAGGREDFDGPGGDSGDGGVEVCRDAALGNAVDEVGANPVFHGITDFGAAHDERDVSPGAGHLQGGFGRGVFGPDDDDVLQHVLVGLLVVVADVGQVLAGHAERVGQVVEAGGHDDVAGRDFAFVGGDGEIALLTGQLQHRFVQADVELFGAGHALVIVQRVFAQGLVVGGGKGVTADFEQIGGGEKLHVGGVAHDGIDQRAFFHDGSRQALALGFEGAGEAHGAGPNDENVEHML